MQNFTRQLLTEWRKLDLPFSGKKFVIAVSGGVDSVALTIAITDLIAKKKLENKFTIAHFNHNLRDVESQKDAEFVKTLAEKLKLEFVKGIANKSEIIKGNLEQNARNLRYTFLKKVARKTNSHAILTAHTVNDQAETFLLNLLRGSGMDGLSAMQTIRKVSENEDILLIRPILNWAKREDTEKFLKNNNIQFRQDSMNDDLDFKRVRIRKELIPTLEIYNPKIIETLVKTAELIGENEKLVSQILSQNAEFNQLVLSPTLPIKKLKSLTNPMLYKILREWLLHQRGDLRLLDSKHFDSIAKLIFSRKSGREIELPNFEKIIKQDGKLIFQKT